MASGADASNANPPNVPLPPPNPPSVEAAYKRKCIELKKRLNEIETHNDAMRVRNAHGLRYIQKMRLESCILLERLAALTGMAEDQGANPELRARAMAMMDETGTFLGDAGPESTDIRDPGSKRADEDLDILNDASDGSSDEHPPTPQDRPLRVKRNRKSDERPADHGANDNNVDSVSSTLPTLPSITPRPRATGYDQHGPSSHHHSPYTPIAPNSVASSTVDNMNQSPAPVRSATIATATTTTPGANTSTDPRSQPIENSFTPVAPGRDQPDRYVSAFEDFTNQNRTSISNALVQAYGCRVTDEDIDRALVKEWDSLEPVKKREYGDRLENDGI